MRVEGIGPNMRVVVIVGAGKIAVRMRIARMMMTLRVIVVEGVGVEAWDAEDAGWGETGAYTSPEPPDCCCCCTMRKDAGYTLPPLNSCDASLPAPAAPMPAPSVFGDTLVGGRIGVVVVASLCDQRCGH